MNGWTAAGNRSDEKKTPEKSHIGSMTRFIRPLTVSVVLARLATSRPMPGERQGADHVDQDHQEQAPADRHAEDEASQQSRTAMSGIRKVSRAPEDAPAGSRAGASAWP